MNVIFKNLDKLLITWVVVMIVNQVFIFGACFAPYCLLAAIPHTFILSVLITYFMNKDDTKDEDR
uniref:hypothetical protein n=1 Tax=Candidatus Thiodubiliella endoseptemdiera TaxID=2738886 RepID=UPI0034DE98E6